MPEMPEVEVVRRQLEKHICGRKVEEVVVRHPKIVRHSPHIVEDLRGKYFISVERIGKLLTFGIARSKSTKQPETYMLGHLKMTGQFIFVEDQQKVGGGHSMTESDFELPHRHTRVMFHFSDGATLYFNDMRLFGFLQIVTPKEKGRVWATYGIEPGRENYTLENFLQIFKNRKTSLKALLLNQKVISGLGNIYVDEACHRSQVRPQRRVNSLTKTEKERLFHNCRDVMMESIEHGGTTFYSFVSSDGVKGNFSQHLEVFDRAGEPCLRCGYEIEKIKHAGRGTHYCPACQK